MNEFSENEEMDEMFEEMGYDKKKRTAEDDRRNDSDLLGSLLKRPNYADIGQSGLGQTGQGANGQGAGGLANPNKEFIQEEEDFSDAQEEMEDSDFSL